jgi:hypothetical protein
MALLEAGVSNLQDRGGQIAVSDMIHVANVALHVMKSWTNDKGSIHRRTLDMSIFYFLKTV